MEAQANLAQNGVINLTVPQDIKSAVVSIGTGATTDAGAIFVIQVETVSGSYVSIGLFDAITQAAAANLTGPSQYGWTDIPGIRKVQVKRTDAAGGDGTVAMSIVSAH